MDLTYEKNSIRLDIGFESNKLENDYSYHYRIELNTLSIQTRDLVQKSILESFQMSLDDIKLDGNVIKIAAEKMTNKISQTTKLQPNLIQLDNYEKDLATQFQYILFKLCPLDSEQADKFFNLIKNENILSENDLKLFENVININKFLIEDKENWRINDEE